MTIFLPLKPTDTCQITNQQVQQLRLPNDKNYHLPRSDLVFVLFFLPQTKETVIYRYK